MKCIRNTQHLEVKPICTVECHYVWAIWLSTSCIQTGIESVLTTQRSVYYSMNVELNNVLIQAARICQISRRKQMNLPKPWVFKTTSVQNLCPSECGVRLLSWHDIQDAIVWNASRSWQAANLWHDSTPIWNSDFNTIPHSITMNSLPLMHGVHLKEMNLKTDYIVPSWRIKQLEFLAEAFRFHRDLHALKLVHMALKSSDKKLNWRFYIVTWI